jgi:hypothetical protein
MVAEAMRESDLLLAQRGYPMPREPCDADAWDSTIRPRRGGRTNRSSLMWSGITTFVVDLHHKVGFRAHPAIPRNKQTPM